MTLNNAFEPSPLPKTIKAAAFDALTEQEVQALRSYMTLDDPSIEEGEVFFYNPQSGVGKTIEGDHFAKWQDGSDYKKASVAAGDYPTNRRVIDNQLVWDGEKMVQTPNKDDQVKVMWYNPTASPAAFELVSIVAL